MPVPHCLTTAQALNFVDQYEKQRIVVIDGGSTGTRAHLFSFIPGSPIDLSTLEEVELNEAISQKSPGLSSFVDNPAAAGADLASLINEAARMVPPAARSSTPVFAYVTGGLRQMTPVQSNAIMESVRTFLNSNSSPFMFTSSSQARVLSGEEEGEFRGLYLLLSRHQESHLVPCAPFPQVCLAGLLPTCLGTRLATLSVPSTWEAPVLK